MQSILTLSFTVVCVYGGTAKPRSTLADVLLVETVMWCVAVTLWCDAVGRGSFVRVRNGGDKRRFPHGVELLLKLTVLLEWRYCAERWENDC